LDQDPNKTKKSRTNKIRIRNTAVEISLSSHFPGVPKYCTPMKRKIYPWKKEL
jgi:hypothetical protein